MLLVNRRIPGRRIPQTSVLVGYESARPVLIHDSPLDTHVQVIAELRAIVRNRKETR